LRAFTDVSVRGLVLREEGATTTLTRVQVGPMRRSIRVFGERTLVRSRTGRVEISSPAVFHEMRIDLEHAFGGTSPLRAGEPNRRRLPRVARGDERDAYLRNPIGKGYVSPGLELQGPLSAPNTEDEAHPITNFDWAAARSWLELPRPAHYGLELAESFPRVASLLPFDLTLEQAERVSEVGQGRLAPGALLVGAEVPTPRIFQASCLELSSHRLEPGAPFRLEGFRRDGGMFAGQLPVQRPLFQLRLPGASPRELVGRMAAVHFDPMAEHITITWAAAQPVFGAYGDALDDAFVSCEWR
jgi:hypothetical protein